MENAYNVFFNKLINVEKDEELNIYITYTQA
jgi:hypothetical protein